MGIDVPGEEKSRSWRNTLNFGVYRGGIQTYRGAEISLSSLSHFTSSLSTPPSPIVTSSTILTTTLHYSLLSTTLHPQTNKQEIDERKNTMADILTQLQTCLDQVHPPHPSPQPTPTQLTTQHSSQPNSTQPSATSQPTTTTSPRRHRPHPQRRAPHPSSQKSPRTHQHPRCPRPRPKQHNPNRKHRRHHPTAPIPRVRDRMQTTNSNRTQMGQQKGYLRRIAPLRLLRDRGSWRGIW